MCFGIIFAFILSAEFTHAVEISLTHKDSSVTRLENAINKSNLIKTVKKLQAYGNRYTLENQWATAEWIKGQLSETGIEGRIDSYEYRDKSWPNVVAKISGRRFPERIVMAIAHFDSIADNQKGLAPGADDNGSGVAALLEIARALQKKPSDKTLMFAFFSNEESGLQGSRNFVNMAAAQELQIEAILNLDVLGYNNSTNLSLAKVIGAHRSIKQKIKAYYRVALNRINRIFKGDSLIIKVAGRTANADLAAIVALQCEKTEGLKVAKIVSDDCG